MRLQLTSTPSYSRRNNRPTLQLETDPIMFTVMSLTMMERYTSVRDLVLAEL
jgi:hypothetical protein